MINKCSVGGGEFETKYVKLKDEVMEAVRNCEYRNPACLDCMNDGDCVFAEKLFEAGAKGCDSCGCIMFTKRKKCPICGLPYD